MKNSDSEKSSSPQRSRDPALQWLEPRSVIVGGAVVAAIGLAFNWNWVVAVGLAPLLFVLPCMLMMGWMMWSMRPKKEADQPAARQDSTSHTSKDPQAAPAHTGSSLSNEE